MSYGLTADGFVKMRLQDILDAMIVDAESAFGPINQNSDGDMMRFLSIEAERLASLWDLAEAVYNGLSPDGAEGAQLDGVAELAGITRLAAVKSTVVVGLTGTAATVVPLGTQFKSATTDDVVESDGAVTIQASDLVHAEVDAGTPQNSTLYRVTIDGTNCDFTSDATATAAEISAGITNAVNTAALGMSATDNGDGTVTLEADDGETGYSVAVWDNGSNLISITELTTPCPCTAQNTGVVLVTEGQIDTIVTPVSGLVSVYNYADGDQGSDTETDAELRLRIRTVRRGAATVDAIKSRITNEVDGATACLVVENPTDAYVGSQPPHSIHVIVCGGTDQDVVDKIWELKGAGIATYGASSGIAVDASGNNHTVYFSRPTTRYGWVRVRYTTYDEEILPVDADAAIAAAVLEYGNTFTSGQDMLWQRFLTPVLNTVPGVKSAQIELDHTATAGGPPSYVTDTDHTVADDEMVQFDATRIDVAEA